MSYRIGQLATKAQVHVETIRYYERKGLLEQPQKPFRGHRTYSEGHLKTLALIQRSKHLGFTLKEISELLSLLKDQRMTCGELISRAKEKQTRILSKIEELEAIQQSLQTVIDSCSCEPTSCPCPVLDTIPDFETEDSSCP